MSLFKVCNWWLVQSIDTTESYDSYSLHCCRLNLEENDKDCIIVGSHSGYLTIYRPVFNHDEDEYTSFSASDVILETKLEFPIIGIISGKFSSSPKEENLLAILHPQKLIICGLNTVAGLSEHGDQNQLNIIAEHVLKVPAFSMCKGLFGSSKGREFICVHHLDGKLKFFEQDGISFECQLPDERTIPSPFLYVPRIDCFMTISPSWELECFRYQDLIDSEQLKKKVVPIWSFCLGEGANDMNVHQISNNESLIVILGDKNLICVSDTGKIKFIKRLDYTAICMTSFVIGWYWEPDARLLIATVSDNGSILIYENRNLIWAAELTQIPVAISRANLVGLPGAIVTLSKTGNLCVGYLGSDPHFFRAPPMDLKQLDFQKAHDELHEIERDIQEGVDFSDFTMINAAAERDFKVQVNIGSLEKCVFATKVALMSEEEPKMVRISVGVRAHIQLETLQVQIFVSPPLKASVDRYVFCDLLLDQTERFDAYIYLERITEVPNLEALVIISTVDKQTLVRVIERRILLPVELLFRVAPAQREAKYKVTIITDESEKDLSKICSGIDERISAFGLRSMAGSVVTVAVSKTSNRIRIQSDEIEAISCVLHLLIQKLLQGKPITIAPPNLPTDQLIDCLKNTQQLRDTFNDLLLDIDRRYAELRLFEIRLTIKSQEENPKISGIQYLIDLTNTKIEILDKKLKSLQEEIFGQQIRLSCIVFLLKQMFQHIGLPKEASNALSGSLSHSVNNFLEQSWEEATFPAYDMMQNVGTLKSRSEDYFSSESLEVYSLQKFIKRIVNVLALAMQLAIKSGSSNELEGTHEAPDSKDDFASDWVNEVPTGATALLAKNGESEFENAIKEESEEE